MRRKGWNRARACSGVEGEEREKEEISGMEKRGNQRSLPPSPPPPYQT